MKNKGFIILSVVVIISILTIIVLNSSNINKNLVNSSYKAIKNEQINIYQTSKLLISDYVVEMLYSKALNNISESLKNLDNNAILDEKKITKDLLYNYNLLITTTNLNSFDEFSNEALFTLISDQNQQKTLFDDLNRIDFSISSYFKKDDNIISFTKNSNYTVILPILNKDDINLLKSSKVDEVFEKYRKDIITDKKVY